MKNVIQPGDTITVTAPYALSAGDGCMVGILFGVACGTYANGAEAELMVADGIFDLTALTTDTASGTAFVAAYWDNTNKRITTTVGANLKVGVIVGAKINGDTTARVRLNGAF